MLKFEPVGSLVLIRELEEERVTKAGIILTEDLNRYTTKGEVVQIGSGERSKKTGKRIPVDLVEGDVVYYTAYANHTEIRQENGDKFVLVNAPDILAKEV